ncbi:hypothetical protein IWQ61_010610 [Dispira simplex]|nr:hypothetical protein IWQ61_010610 [Dispira simplex]
MDLDSDQPYSVTVGQTIQTSSDTQPSDSFHLFRYTFKPDSHSLDNSGELVVNEAGQFNVDFNDGREHHYYEALENMAKDVDCILIFNPATQTFILEQLDSTLVLKSVRKLGTAPVVPPTVLSLNTNASSSSSFACVTTHKTGEANEGSTTGNSARESFLTVSQGTQWETSNGGLSPPKHALKLPPIAVSRDPPFQDSGKVPLDSIISAELVTDHSDNHCNNDDDDDTIVDQLGKDLDDLLNDSPELRPTILVAPAVAVEVDGEVEIDDELFEEVVSPLPVLETHSTSVGISTFLPPPASPTLSSSDSSGDSEFEHPPTPVRMAEATGSSTTGGPISLSQFLDKQRSRRYEEDASSSSSSGEE